MGDYKRSSRECNLEDLGEEVISAVNTHLDKYNLGPILNDTSICIEVTSEKIKKGLFAGPGPRLTRMAVVLTPRWLVQVTKPDSDAAFARSARLENIVVIDYEKSPFYARIPDNGVEVTGKFTDTIENSSSFIGLGKDAAGEKFKQMILKAVQESKK